MEAINIYKNRSTILVNKIFMRSNVAHHGLQRSGTNYLNECLKVLGIKTVNNYDPPRNHPSHKHFRWQENKGSITPIEPLYYNNLICKDLKSLNEIAGFPDNTKHIVIKKDLISWLTSIVNWGIRVGWFKTKEDALNCCKEAASDYENYYDFWEGMEENNRESVRIIRFDELFNDPNGIIITLKDFGIKYSFNEGFKEKTVEVPKSPADRKNWVTREEIYMYLNKKK